MSGLLFAIRFLTRIPVPTGGAMPDEPTQGRAALFYPLVGALIGALLSLFHLLMGNLEGGFQAALLLTLWVGITGGLHLDGLADLADAWVGGQGERERTLRIMQDPGSGPIAVTALILVLLLKFVSLQALIGSATWSALLLVPVIGRAGILAALLYIPYVRPGGLGAVQAAWLPRRRAVMVLAAVALLLLLSWGWPTHLLLAVLAGAFLLMRRMLTARIGGITGDGLGAVCELFELLALVTLVAVGQGGAC